MRPAKATGLAVAFVVVAFAGCLRAPGTPDQVPSVPGDDTLDLDPIFDNQTRPFGPLTWVDVTTEESRQVTPNVSSAPWFVDEDHVLHSDRGSETSAIALTKVGDDRTNTTVYTGRFSASGDAEFPSAGPGGETVYFSHVPSRGPPKIVRRPIGSEGNETVVASLRSEDIPQGPWAVSPNGSKLAGTVWSGSADGPSSQIAIRELGAEGSERTLHGFTGAHPRFVSDSQVVFERGTSYGDGGIFRFDTTDETVTSLVRASTHEMLRQPVVAADRMWFLAQVRAGEDGRIWEEVRSVSLDGEQIETVAWSESYRLGRFDVSPDLPRLILEVYGPR